MKKFLKRLLSIIGILTLIVGIYIAYVFISYYRVEDKQDLSIHQYAINQSVKTDHSYRITSANIGFGAYSDDYSFFMDGGTYSRALSAQAVKKNINGSLSEVKELNPDFAFFQEVDIDGTRSYHINQYDWIEKKMNDYSTVFAQNYDSPYLFYPITSPHGKNKSGLVTCTNVQARSAVRRSLPIETGVSKFIDLDRCYMKERLKTENGHELILYNFHLSAYTTNESTSIHQLKMLLKDMEAENKRGNYTVAGGDFNKDLLKDSYSIFKQGNKKVGNWAKPLPERLEPASLQIVAPYDKKDPIPSCRNADQPYSKKVFVLTVDGFITSKNVEVIQSNVKDTRFKYSDHNPVYMDFKLK